MHIRRQCCFGTANAARRTGGLLGTLLGLWACAGVVWAGGSSVSQPANAEWPQWKGNAGHNPVSPDDSVKPPLRLVWSYRTDGDTTNDALAGVVVGGGKVFVPVANTNSILVLDANTGRFQWEFSDLGSYTDPPAYHDGRLYVWLRGRGRNEVVALNAADGQPVWRKSFAKGAAGGRKRGAMTFWDGKLYHVEGGAERAVLALDAKTGETVWRTPLGAEDGPRPLAPSVAGGLVFVATRATFDPSRELVGSTVALDAKSGEVRWRRKGIYPFNTPATDGEVLAIPVGFSPPPSDKFHLLDAKTGETLWTHSRPMAYSSATILKDMVLIHPNGSGFLAVDRKTGQKLWDVGVGRGSGCHPPAVAGGTAYLGSGGPFGSDNESLLAWSWVKASEQETPIQKGWGCSLNAVDLKTGKRVWYFPTGNNVCGDTAIAYGRIYFDSRDGRVYCFAPAKEGEPTVPEASDQSPNVPVEEVKKLVAAPLAPPRPGKDWPMYGGSPDRDGIEGLGLDPPLAPAWKFDAGGRVCTAPAIRDGRVFFGSDSGKIFALDAAGGGKVWEFQTGEKVRSSPAAADGTVYCGSDDGRLYALSAADGKKRWEFECGGPVQASPAVAGGVVVFGANDHHTYALDRKTGKKLWSFRGSYYNHQAPPVVHGDRVFAAQWVDWVRALELTTGKELWRSYAPVTIEALAWHRDRLYLRTPYYIMEYDPETGKRLRMGDASCGFGGMAFMKGLLFQSGIQGQYGTPGATCLDLDAPGGEPKKTPTLEDVRRLAVKGLVGGGRLGSMGVPLALGDKVCIATVAGEVTLVASDGKMLWSARLGGTCHAPPVAADGLLVVGADDGCLYAFRGKRGA